MTSATNPCTSMGPSETNGATDYRFNTTKSWIKPSTSAGPYLECHIPTNNNAYLNVGLNSGRSGCHDVNNANLAEEPLLDYEDYFKDEDTGRGKKNSSKNKKGKRTARNQDAKPSCSSIAEQIGKQIATIRAFASWRKPRDLREEARQEVLAARSKNKDKLLFRRRCGAAWGKGEKLDKLRGREVGETDPLIYSLMWRFQHLSLVEESSPKPWRLPICRKRVAPSVDTVTHFDIPEVKRRKLS